LHGGGILQYYLRGDVRSLFRGITLNRGEEGADLTEGNEGNEVSF
jgi:hypothetical protein